MTVHAGLDEAGYGPMLGPLTVGFSAFRREGELDWRALAGAVSDAPGEDRDRLVVADSKRVFTRNPRGARRLVRMRRKVAETTPSWLDANLHRSCGLQEADCKPLFNQSHPRIVHDVSCEGYGICR